MDETLTRTTVAMDTFVTIQVVRPRSEDRCAEQVARAFRWFGEVERRCSRFDPTSEVMGLFAHVGEPVPVSPILFETVRFALAVAEASGGAFDPTVGHALERQGFNRNYRTGELVRSALETAEGCSYRDVVLDPARRTITLRRPLVLDLGAVAKGFAVDLAAQELRDFPSFAVDAGGDLYLRGRNPAGERWQVGIRHPLLPDELIASLSVSDRAVCTSGGYERPAPNGGDGHHIVDPQTGRSPAAAASVTVVAPTAVLADALATAALVLGPRRGLTLLEREGVDGMIVTRTIEQHATPRFSRYRS